MVDVNMFVRITMAAISVCVTVGTYLEQMSTVVKVIIKNE